MERLAIATFNLKNLSVPRKVSDGARQELSQEDYARKIDWTAEQLRRMDADVVGFQEVIHKKALEDALVKSGIYPNATVVMADEDGVFPTVALVSRLPVRHVEFFKNFPPNSIISMEGVTMPIDRWTRPILRADIECVNGQRIAVFVAHLKSMRPDFRLETGAYEHDFLERAMGKTRSLLRRAAEALALRALLLPFLKGGAMPLVVMGDLNDQAGSTTSELITGTPPYRTLPSAKRQEVLDHLLVDVADFQARRSERHQYYTHIHNGRFECLDHIMVSRGLHSPDANAVGLVDYVRTFTDHLIDITVSGDKVPSWQSDHGQLMAILRIFEPAAPGSRPDSRGANSSRHPVMLSEFVSRSLLSPDTRRPESRARAKSPRPHHQPDPVELPP
eukprot:m.14042 g.14042  ORF g.14042 m.14042 type:complete len:390 (+) comp6326_c1_seq1:875-2044(+)